MKTIQHSQTFLSEDDIQAALAVLGSGVINDSDMTTEFENQFARFIGVPWARATSTGTLALYLALRVLELKPQAEVILPAYVCEDALSAVRFIGATPKLADIDLSDFNIDPPDVARKISDRTGAIICPHLFGMPARLSELLQLQVPVIEDCAHAVGAVYRGKRVGSLGALAIFSFHALKCLPVGEGGMITTRSGSLWERLGHYDAPDMDAGEFALNFHLSNILSAIGLSQLRNIEVSLRKREKIARTYHDGLHHSKLTLPLLETSDRKSSVLRYCVMIPEGYGIDEVCKVFASQKIIVRRPVKRVLHNIRGFEEQYCPNSQIAYDRVLSLPAHLLVREEEQGRIIEMVQRVFS